MNKKIRYILVVLLALFLQACIPAALVAGTAAGGLIINDNRSVRTMNEDHEITFKAQSAINTNKSLKGQTHISVATFNHLVLMVGQAPTEELRNIAASLVEKVPNVKHIYNEITIGAPISIAARSHDSWITTKVETALVAQKGLHSTQIKIVTENSTVYLLGLVIPSQGNLAAEAASTVPGVVKVVKAFEYLK